MLALPSLSFASPATNFSLHNSNTGWDMDPEIKWQSEYGLETCQFSHPKEIQEQRLLNCDNQVTPSADKAMAYILPLTFFSFSMPNLWNHWTDLNQTWTHSHLWLLVENFPETPPGIYPHGLGQKNFWDRLEILTEHISATEHDINNRKLTCQSTGTSLHAPKFG